MTLDLDILERQRERWRRARHALRLDDISCQHFATGGLASFIPDIGARLLILPPDPEAHVLDFDEEFWKWWLTDTTDPITASPMRWGIDSRPGAMAAARFARAGTDQWYRYLALHRHGGLEFGLAQEAVHRHEHETVFWLSRIVGRIWSACAVYKLVLERLSLVGPFEMTLALRNTAGAVFGNLAEGWMEPTFGLPGEQGCREPHILLRREFSDFQKSRTDREIAFSLGAQLEDTFGVSQRRFISHRGEFVGQFDRRKYSWD